MDLSIQTLIKDIEQGAKMLGIPKKEIISKSGFSIQSWRNWKTGKYSPSEENLQKIKNARYKLYTEDLKEKRKKNNLSQSALAESLGIGRSTYQRWEIGEVVPSECYRKKIEEFYKKHKRTKAEQTELIPGELGAKMVSEKLVKLSNEIEEEKELHKQLINEHIIARQLENVSNQFSETLGIVTDEQVTRKINFILTLQFQLFNYYEHNRYKQTFKYHDCVVKEMKNNNDRIRKILKEVIKGV